MLLLNLNFFSSRTTNISSTTNSPEVEAPLILQIIHPGGIVERYYMAFPAAFIIQKYPKSVLARPEVFQRPWDSVVRPEEILVPGHKYFVVPILTVKKLRTRMMKSDNNNIFNADAGHETGTKPRRVRFKGGDQAKTRHVDDYDHDSEDNKAKKNKKKKSLNGKGLRKKKNVELGRTSKLLPLPQKVFLCSNNINPDNKIMATNLKSDLQELSLEEDTNNTTKTISTCTPSSPTTKKPSATKINCLCAPTDHPGSFRCRRHRTNLSGLGNRRTVSVGANLHQLGNNNTKQSREY